MKDILVLKKMSSNQYAYKVGTGTVDTLAELSALEEGSISFFEKNGTWIDGTGAGVIGERQVYACMGRAAAYGTKRSILIDRPTLSYEKSVYVAPVAEVKYIGYNGSTVGTAFNMPSSLTNGTIAGILIINNSISVESPMRKKRYEHQVVTGDTAAIIVADLVAQINADPNRIVNAVGVSTNTGISLTRILPTVPTVHAPIPTVRFSVALYGVLEAGTTDEDGYITGTTTVGISTPANDGNGTSNMVKELERIFRVQDGDTTQAAPFSNAFYPTPYMTVDGQTYHIYSLKWSYPNTREAKNGNGYDQELIICVDTTSFATITAIDNILVKL